MASLGLAGCSASGEAQSAGEAASRFAASLGSPEAACALLAPGTRTELMDQSGSSCQDALTEEHLSLSSTVSSVEIAGHSAEVVLGGDGVLFLARFDDGWKVTAAGCSRDSDDESTPYDCSVKGA